MKKLLILPLMLLSLSACDSNEEPIKGLSLSNTYTKVHIYNTNKCYNIITWCNSYDETFKIKLENETEIMIHKNQCFLVNGKCPICESEQ